MSSTGRSPMPVPRAGQRYHEGPYHGSPDHFHTPTSSSYPPSELFQPEVPPPLPPKPPRVARNDDIRRSAVEERRMEQRQGIQQAASYPATAGAGAFVAESRYHPMSNQSTIMSGGMMSGAMSSTKSLNHQKDDEIHLLRMLVSDKEADIAKLHRDLEHCHTDIKQLNTILGEKKETVLKYQERLSDLQSENANLKQMGAARGAVQPSSSADQALHAQIHQLRQQIQVLQQQKDLLIAEQQQWRQPQPPPSSSAGNQALVEEIQALRKQLEGNMHERSSLMQEISVLRSRVEVLNHQVATYNEDFQSERLDRERAHAQIHSLKEENDSLNQAITLLAKENGIRLDTYGLEGHRN